MNEAKFQDPVIIGPGIWFQMHLQAAHATTPQLKAAFRENIKLLIDNFKCTKCQEHFRKFYEKYPLNRYENIRDQEGNDIGYFRWTWELHDQVNAFLKKPRPSLKEAYSYYRDETAGVCTDCGGKEENTINLPPIITQVKPITKLKFVSRNGY